MKIKEIRRINLDNLIGRKGEHGRIADFARDHGFDPSYLSQLLNKNRTIGEKSARNIEEALGLEPSHLDRSPAGEADPHAADIIAQEIGDDAVALLEDFRNASPELRAAAMRMLQTHSPSKKASPAK